MLKIVWRVYMGDDTQDQNKEDSAGTLGNLIGRTELNNGGYTETYVDSSQENRSVGVTYDDQGNETSRQYFWHENVTPYYEPSLAGGAFMSNEGFANQGHGLTNRIDGAIAESNATTRNLDANNELFYGKQDQNSTTQKTNTDDSSRVQGEQSGLNSSGGESSETNYFNMVNSAPQGDDGLDGNDVVTNEQTGSVYRGIINQGDGYGLVQSDNSVQLTPNLDSDLAFRGSQGHVVATGAQDAFDRVLPYTSRVTVDGVPQGTATVVRDSNNQYYIATATHVIYGDTLQGEAGPLAFIPQNNNGVGLNLDLNNRTSLVGSADSTRVQGNAITNDFVDTSGGMAMPLNNPRTDITFVPISSAEASQLTDHPLERAPLIGGQRNVNESNEFVAIGFPLSTSTSATSGHATATVLSSVEGSNGMILSGTIEVGGNPGLAGGASGGPVVYVDPNSDETIFTGVLSQAAGVQEGATSTTQTIYAAVSTVSDQGSSGNLNSYPFGFGAEPNGIVNLDARNETKTEEVVSTNGNNSDFGFDASDFQPQSGDASQSNYVATEETTTEPNLNDNVIPISNAPSHDFEAFNPDNNTGFDYPVAGNGYSGNAIE